MTLLKGNLGLHNKSANWEISAYKTSGQSVNFSSDINVVWRRVNIFKNLLAFYLAFFFIRVIKSVASCLCGCLWSDLGQLATRHSKCFALKLNSIPFWARSHWFAHSSCPRRNYCMWSVCSWWVSFNLTYFLTHPRLCLDDTMHFFSHTHSKVA